MPIFVVDLESFIDMNLERVFLSEQNYREALVLTFT